MSEFRFLLATRLRTVSPSARAESRSSSEINPKKPESSPRANSLTPKKEWPTPSPGLPMRTVSRPPVTTCPLPHPCPSTSSRCWLTWEPLANCKLIKPITNQMPSLFNHPSFNVWTIRKIIKHYSSNSPSHSIVVVASRLLLITFSKPGLAIIILL